jgi:hypothetical protein
MRLGERVNADPLLVGLVPLVVAGIALWLWISGAIYPRSYVEDMKERHEKEVSELKQALALERARNELGEQASRILVDFAQGLRKEIT